MRAVNGYQNLLALMRDLKQGTPFSHCADLFRTLDRWLRMRLRCMKYKRESRADNGRFRLERFRRLGILFLSDLRPAPA